MNTTPYINDDGDLWYKAKGASYQEARRLAAQFARDTLNDWGRSRFMGRVVTDVHEHEYDPATVPTECEEKSCEPAQPCWHFEIYES